MGRGANQGGLSRKHVIEGVNACLARLGLDYVDQLVIHRHPHGVPGHANVPIEETMEALHDVVKAGKVLSLGASSMFAWQFAELQLTARMHGWTGFVSMQNHYNLVYREEEREMLPLCQAEGIGVIPWSPLARGFLAGNRKRGSKDATLREQHDGYGHSLYYADRDYDVAERVVAVAKQKGVLPIQVALAWVANRPGVTAPIISATRIEQLDQLIAGMKVTLTADEQKAVEEVYQPHPVLGTGP
jgi:aryl-alcohol dehydrogenase (NADP+)